MTNEVLPQEANDVAELKAQLHIEREARLSAEQQLRSLQESFLKLQKQIFGRKSEKLSTISPDQQALFESSLDTLAPLTPLTSTDDFTEVAPHKRKKKRKIADLSELPRERIEYEPEEQECSACGTTLEKFGEDIEEEIEFVPARYYVKEHVKIKKSCPCCKSGVFTGVVPDTVRILPKCKYGAGLLSKIVVSKYMDHLPLYRQVEIFEREGLQTTRATLSRLVIQIAFLLRPVANALREEILRCEAIHADETRLKRQTEEKKGLHTGQLWGVLGPPGVFYKYDDSRSVTVVKQLLGEAYEGYVHSDHYCGYEPEHLPAGALRVGCWAHARRKFVEAVTVATKERDQVLRQIATIYKVEKKLKRLSDAERKKARLEKMKPLFESLETYLKALSQKLLPGDGLQQAIHYVRNQWTELTRVLEHGALELDTNAIERQMKSIALGRKNYLFAGSEEGAKAAATLYSLLNTCKIHKINPVEYLRDILPRLGTLDQSRVHELMPLAWKNS